MTPIAADRGAADASQLLAAWAQERARGLNNRATATALGVSEAELIASGCGRFVTRLRAETVALLRALPLLGEIKAVIRNPTAVVERAGIVHSIQLTAVGVILVQADRFEMVCQPAHWQKAFALREETAAGNKLSIQFFTPAGISAAKFFLRPASDAHAFANLVNAFAKRDQSPQETVEVGAAEPGPRSQGLALAPGGALLAFLEASARSRHALTFVVRNAGACLATNKVIERVKRSAAGGWVNVLDDGLDVHLHEDRIRYLRPVPDTVGDGGWLHWFSDQKAIALSVRCGRGWHALAPAAGVQRRR